VKLDKIIPEPTAIAREAIIVLGGVLIAAWILSKFPALQSFVAANSITVKSDQGSTLW
jgi:hypothetical protein